MKYVLFFILVAASWNAHAQNRINNLFVNSTENIVRLDFSNTVPTVHYLGFGSGANIGEGIAHIENKNGEAIILVNSRGIYDINGTLMPGSQGILAHPSSTEIVICRKPSSANLYYVIYNSQLCSSLFYSVVDLSKRNGLGDVIELNRVLDNQNQYAEGLEIVGVPCSNNFLLLAYRCYTGFVKFEITEEGFSAPAVVHPMNATSFGGRGELDYRNGKLGYAMTFSNKAFFADFDVSTGTLTNPRVVSFGATNGIYGLEFSANASRVYVTDLDNRNLFGQIISPNLFCYTFQTNAIQSWTLDNQSTCSGSDPQGLGQIEIGKDLNLYVPVIGGCKIYVVRQANDNPVIDYLETTAVLSAGLSDHIKSEFLDEVIPEPIIQTTHDTLVLCRDEIIELATDPIANAELQWYFNNDVIPNATDPILVTDKPGKYYVRASTQSDCGKSSSTVSIVTSSLKPLQLTDTVICPDTSVELHIDEEGASIVWSDGDITSHKTFHESGMYQVNVSKDGCTEHGSFAVKVLHLNPQSLPNVITPNGDPLNEYFVIPMDWPSVDLTIFNRWGGEVYTHSNYQSQWNGLTVPPAVYYYAIYSQYACLNMKGWIHVIR